MMKENAMDNKGILGKNASTIDGEPLYWRNNEKEGKGKAKDGGSIEEKDVRQSLQEGHGKSIKIAWLW